jgi:pilus assembly protein FimV
MSEKAPWLARCLLFCGLVFSLNSWSLNLGNIQLLSQGASEFKAKIAILGSSKELQQLKGFKVQFPSSEVYQQFGLPLPKDESNPFLLSIEKAEDGTPIAILITSKTVIPEDTLFKDLVLELSWSGGKLIRIYTILNPRRDTFLVNEGDNLSKITQSLLPELPQASFEQALLAIFRLNPNAFIAGNIHRLKLGAQLNIPTTAMVESIPKEEAKQFSYEAQSNFQNKLFSQSSEITFDSKEHSTHDQLLLSSSEGASEKRILETKLEEELVAQKKILEQAQARIVEIQKNISDLNQHASVEGKSELSSHSFGKFEYLKDFLFFLGLTAIFIYGNLVRKSPLFAPLILKKEEEIHEVPEFAKNIFATLDLNLDTPPPPNQVNSIVDNALSKQQEPIEKNTVSDKKIPSIPNQKLRLNLAKSYIQINDYPTAKIILQELVQLGADGQEEIVLEAQKYLVQIA